MAQIIRMFWRLDFGVSYPYLNKRGSALNAMTNTVTDFWEVVADGTIHSSYVGSTKDSHLYRNISVEPNSLNGDLQWVSGIDLSNVFKDEVFSWNR